VRRTATIWAMVALASLAAVWLWTPSHSPPLYDGVCVSNPYQYLDPPPGAPTTPPSSGKHSVDISNDVVPGTIVMTAEFPAQAQLSTDDGSLIVHGAHRVTLTIDAVHAPVVKPSGGGSIDGNVYRFGATSDTGVPVNMYPAKPPTLTLRTPTSSGQTEVIEHFDGTRWTALTTQPAAGCAFLFSAPITGTSEYALATSTSPSPIASGPPGSTGGAPASGGVPVPLIVIALVIVILGGGLALLRRHNLARANATANRTPGKRKPRR